MPDVNEPMASPVVQQIRIKGLEEKVDALEGKFDSFTKDIRQMFHEYQDDAKRHRPSFMSVWIPAIMTMGFVGTIALYVINAQTDGKLIPLQISLQSTITQLTAIQERMKPLEGIPDQVSNMQSVERNDYTVLSDMRDHLGKNDEKINRAERFESIADAKFAEVETQFHAIDQIDNEKFAKEQRDYSLLWNKASGVNAPYPQSPYFFPQIAKPYQSFSDPANP